MTRTEELLALAEAATPITVLNDNGEETGWARIPSVSVRPETIKQLVELVRLQHEALTYEGAAEFQIYGEAIEAFNKWEGK
jgi:hypothetical protein